MTRLILLATALASCTGFLRAQLAQPPPGVTEGVLKELTNACPANPRSCPSGRVARLVGLGRSGQRALSNQSCSRSHGRRCTQAEAQVDASDFLAPRACIRNPPWRSAESSWEATTASCIRWTLRRAAFTGPTRPICLAGSLPSPRRSPGIRAPATRSSSSPAPPLPTRSMRMTANCSGKRRSAPD